MDPITESLIHAGLRPAEARALAASVFGAPEAEKLGLILVKAVHGPLRIALSASTAGTLLSTLARELGLPAPELPQDKRTLSLEEVRKNAVDLAEVSSGPFRPRDREALARLVDSEVQACLRDVLLSVPLSMPALRLLREVLADEGRALAEELVRSEASFPDFFKLYTFFRTYLLSLGKALATSLTLAEKARKAWVLLASEVEKELLSALEALRSELALLAHPDILEPDLEDLQLSLLDLAWEALGKALDGSPALTVPLLVDLVLAQVRQALAERLAELRAELAGAQAQAFQPEDVLLLREELLRLSGETVRPALAALAQAAGEDPARVEERLVAKVQERLLSRLGGPKPSEEELRSLLRETFRHSWPEVLHG